VIAADRPYCEQFYETMNFIVSNGAPLARCRPQSPGGLRQMESPQTLRSADFAKAGYAIRIRLRGGEVASCSGGQVRVDRCSSTGDAWLDRRHNDQAQSHDCAGQHNPVNCHGTVFVFCEMLENVQEFHGRIPFPRSCSVCFTVTRLLVSASVPTNLRFGLNAYGPQNVAAVGKNRDFL
jgi:hypothetical protein